jgi:chemotaxis protein MotB
MKGTAMALIMMCSVTVLGCVSSGTYKQTLAELEEARKTSAKTAAEQARLEQERAAEKARLEQERAAQEAEIQRLTQTTEDLTKSKEQVAAALTEARAQAQEETSRLQATLQQEKERLKAEEAEKVRLEQERAAKEAEIQRLTQTHADLTKSLQAEIAKGDIRIKQVRDRLTINMVDRVLFDSGQGQVKPAGLKVLKQVSDILKNVTDKQIRIEGHTDNVPIGAKLKGKFTTNWELSTARATSVVRYLIDEGGVDRANLSAVGYADMRPVASNDTEEGRTANRRIEITLYPKDLSGIASQIKP